MAQRVNLTYSIKLEDLELEVKRILNRTLDQLEEAYTDYDHLTEIAKILSVDTFNEVNKLREELTNLDHVLADVNNILSSYLNYEAQETMASPTTTDDAE